MNSQPFSLISSLMASINGFRTLLNRTGPSHEAMSNILTESSKFRTNSIIFFLILKLNAFLPFVSILKLFLTSGDFGLSIGGVLEPTEMSSTLVLL